VGCPRTFPRSKHLNLSFERAFGAYTANHDIDVATQHNICVTNQDTAKHSTTSVKPIKSEKIKQWCRDRPRSDALVFRAVPASIVEYRLKLFALVGFFDAATWFPARNSKSRVAAIARIWLNYQNFIGITQDFLSE